MTWFKVDDSFSTHPKVLSIPRGAPRLRAVGLWTTVGTWCARHLTDGHFATHMVEDLGGTKADARRLVDAGLWESTATGFVFHNWCEWQPTKAAVEADRAAARDRMAKNRSKKQPGSVDVRPNIDRTSRPVRVTPSRPVPSSAAAAADTPDAGPAEVAHTKPLPPPLEILRTRCVASKLDVRWDRLTPTDVAEVEALIDLHGDAALVKSALVQHRPDHPAAFAQAWLPAWRSLALPGERLRLVDEDPCPEPGHSGTTRRCNQCAADSKAAR